MTGRSVPHLLRHPFANHAPHVRPNRRAVQEVLDHSSVTATQRYVDADDLRRQVAETPANRPPQ